MFANTVSNRSFSTGFTFFYWKYYKYHRKENKLKTEYIFNLHAHDGYEPHHLYVEQKYSHVKEELQNNKIFTINNILFDSALRKANKYVKIQLCRKLTANRIRNHVLHYDVSEWARMRASNILSVLLYTDYTDLCTKFSSTFRKKNVFEPLSAVIERNREFAIWSRILRETVELFGCGFEYGDVGTLPFAFELK